MFSVVFIFDTRVKIFKKRYNFQIISGLRWSICFFMVPETWLVKRIVQK